MLARFVPAFGGLGAEHAPGAEACQEKRGDDQAGEDGAQGGRCPFVRTVRGGLEESGHESLLGEGVAVELVPP